MTRNECMVNHLCHTQWGWWAVVHVSQLLREHKYTGGKEIPALSASQPDNSGKHKLQVNSPATGSQRGQCSYWHFLQSMSVCIYIYIICIGCTSILSACLWEMLKRSCILITSPNPGNLILTAREREQLKVTDFRVCGSLVFTILLTLLLPEIKSKPHLTSERLQFASKVLPKPQL